MSTLSTLTTKTLRRKAHELDLQVRHCRNWNGMAGNDGYVVTDWRHNFYLAGPFDEDGLRDYLIEALTP